MKVCVVGHFQDDLDEGVRIVGKEMARHLIAHGIEVKRCNLSLPKLWKELKSFQPEIVHFVISPTLLGLVLTKITSLCFPNAKYVVSAVHSAINESIILRYLKPDLILVQSEESEEVFLRAGFDTYFLPNGVDTEKFRPLNRKEELREKYGVPKDKFVVLHLASLKKERNLGILCDIQRLDNYHVIVIGREKENSDSDVISELRQAGCDVWIRHFAQIEEIYNLADCYIFPTDEKRACIETPLSVLEALACGIPVVSTKFGALPRLIDDQSKMVSFIVDENDYFEHLCRIKNSHIDSKIRMNVPYSWNSITRDLAKIYGELVETTKEKSAKPNKPI